MLKSSRGHTEDVFDWSYDDSVYVQSGPGKQGNQKRTIFKNVRTEDTVFLKVHMPPDASCVFPLAQPRSAGLKAVPNGLFIVIFKAILQVFYITIRTKNLLKHIDF